MGAYIYEADLDEHQKAKVVATAFAPGESVKLHPSVTGDKREALERAAAANGGLLTVRTVVLTGELKLQYEFEEVAGRFADAYVTDPREMAYMFGALVRAEGKTFAVELEGDSDDPHPGRVLRIGGAPERYVAWNQRLTTEEELAAYAEEPDGVCGEFALADRGDGTWALVAIPWSAAMSDVQMEIAKGAVEFTMTRAPRLH